VPLFLVVAGTMGLVGPVKQAFLHQLIDPAEQATIVSLALLRRLRAPADAIVGTGGRQGPCAGLGLPSVASIDATRGPAT
jgi:hypothetical protein